MLAFLEKQFAKDKSSLIKYSLNELYENYIDNKLIEEFEAKEKETGPKFLGAKEILADI